MLPIMKWVVVLCAALSAGSAGAAELMLAGGVYEDRAALAIRANFVPAAGVTVRLYRDGETSALATTKTDAGGVYVFRVAAPADYWVAVDSRTIAPQGAWAEQTFGPAGSLCARPDGSTPMTLFEGSCFSGRTAGKSDDPSSLATSEHVARVALRESATRVDFAFSFDAVTNTADDDGIQGSLRQFVTNANAVPGPNRMRFVPVEAAREQRQTISGTAPRWWSIVLRTPLPELRDEDTVIDGTAYNFVSAASVANVHPGRHGEPPTLRIEENLVSRLQKPELELTMTGAEGIVCTARCGIRALALHGAPTAIVTRADARIEHVLVGAAPDLTPVVQGTVGLSAEKGIAYARHLYVTLQTRAGIIVGKGARLDGEHLEIYRCGEPQSGGGIVLLSDGSLIRASALNTNAGAGVIIGSLDGSTPATANTLDGNTISGNMAGVVLGPGSSRNVIARNDIMWNRFGGVATAPFTAAPPLENRFTANRFDENGLRPIILNLGADDPNELSRGADSCARTAGAANSGIHAPRITSVSAEKQDGAARVVIRGRACPGEIVELYQSFVTSEVRGEAADLPHVRSSKVERETMSNQEREYALPSIGEFNYLGATNTRADGTFEAAFPMPVPVRTDNDRPRTQEETNVWASQVLPGADPSDRAFSAIAIDAAGNTSEMSVRRKVD